MHAHLTFSLAKATRKCIGNAAQGSSADFIYGEMYHQLAELPTFDQLAELPTFDQLAELPIFDVDLLNIRWLTAWWLTVSAMRYQELRKGGSPSPGEESVGGGDTGALQAEIKAVAEKVEALEKGQVEQKSSMEEKLKAIEEGKADKAAVVRDLDQMKNDVTQQKEMRKSDLDALGKLTEKVTKLTKKVGGGSSGGSSGPSPEPGEGGANMSELKEKLQQVEEETNKNLDFRIDQLKIDDLRKKVADLTSVSGIHSTNIDKHDQRTTQLEGDRDRMADDTKKLRERLDKYKDKTDKKMGKLKTTCETLLKEKIDDWESEQAARQGE